MTRHRDSSSGETLKHALVVALLACAAALVENFKDSDWVRGYFSDFSLRLGAVIGVTGAAFATVWFIGRWMDRNRRIAEAILDRQPLQSAAGTLDGVWIDAVWNGEMLVGGSIFSLKSSRLEGFKLNGEFYMLDHGVLSREPAGWFNGIGQQIDEFGFAYRYEGGEHGVTRPVDHNGTGYYHFHGKPGWKVQTFHGHFAIFGALQVRVVRGERRSENPDAEIRTKQGREWVEEYLRQFQTATAIAERV